MKAISGAAIVTTFGLLSSYQITKRIEKQGWKEIEQKVQKPIITDENTLNTVYINRETIANTLHHELQSDQVRTCVVSSPKHYGKTTLLKHAFHSTKLSYIYLDFHNAKQADSDALISLLEDNMNDPNWYRLLMRKFYPNYHHYLMQRWINNIRTLSSEMQLKQPEPQQSITPSPWIVMDGLHIDDIITNDQFTSDICLLNQQLSTDFETASVLLSVSSESPLKVQHCFANNPCTWNNHIWVSQFESREHALHYIQCKLSHIKHITDRNIHAMIDFCRLNIDDINYCIDEVSNANKSDTETHELVLFDDIWKDIKQKRFDFYRMKSPLFDWSDVGFWRDLTDQSMEKDGEISKEFEWNVCKYLLYDYLTSIVVVGSTASDIIQYFAGNKEIVNALYKDGCFCPYGANVTPPFELLDETVLMPTSHIEFEAFGQMLKENKILSDMMRVASRHYIFTRELRRAEQDVDRIQREIEVFNAAQTYVDEQKKKLNDEQRTHLEIDILSKNKSFDAKLTEAIRRCANFKKAKRNNLKKFTKMNEK